MTRYRLFLGNRVAGGAPGNVTVNVTGISLAISTHDVADVVGKAIVTTTGTSTNLAISTHDVASVVGKANVDATTNLLTITCGNATVTAGGSISVNADTNFAAIFCGDVTVTANQSVSVSTTGNSLAISTNDVVISLPVSVTATGNSLAIATQIATARGSPGTHLGSSMSINSASTTNPTTTTTGGAMVETDDLVFVSVCQESSNNSTAVNDNLGNTYTACNAGSDAGSVAGRAYYSIVTVPGFLTGASVTATANSNNIIVHAAAFQGPYTTIDANPANSVNVDLVTPYDAPTTGTLAQADELVVVWMIRSDTTNMIATAPLLGTSSLSSGSMRSFLGRQVVASTTTLTPQTTSASDPVQNASGTTTFKFATGLVNVTTTGNSLGITCGNVTVTAVANISVSATGNQLTITCGDVVTGIANVDANVTGEFLTVSVGDAYSSVPIVVPVTGESLTTDIQYTSVRTSPGTTLGQTLAIQTGSITNPLTTTSFGCMVEVDDLIYVTLAQEAHLTVTAMADSLGNTYTACNSGNDAGAVGGRAFYSIVTVPGFLASVSATTTASTDNAILQAVPFQGPFTGIDVNPINSTVDLVSPFDAPTTGTLVQPNELLVSWAMRSDTVNIVPAAPMLSLASLSSAGLRSAISRQVTAATTSLTPQWSSASNPTSLIIGVTTFKIFTGTSVSVSVAGFTLACADGFVVAVTTGEVDGVEMAISIGDVTVNTITYAAVTGEALTMGSMATVGNAVVRLLFGNPLGPMLTHTVTSIGNPFVTVSNQTQVEVNDLIYANIVEQTNLTVSSVTDNLGHTYTALLPGSDAGSITCRDFYTLVTNPGMLTVVSAAVASSGHNAGIIAQAFQGPFTNPPLDSNPANVVNTDITSPYLGPSTGTLTQADELLIAWATRPDGVAITPVAPLISIGQLASSSILRMRVDYQVLAATTAVQPSWTSATNPIQFMSGVSSFKKGSGSGIDVDAEGFSNTINVLIGDVTVEAEVSITADAPTNLVTVACGDVIVDAKAGAAALSDQLTISTSDVVVTAVTVVEAASFFPLVVSVGDVTVTTSGSTSVNVTGIALAISVGDETVIAGTGVSVSVTMTFMLASMGNETVTCGAGASPIAMSALTMTAGTVSSVTGKANVAVANVPPITITAGDVTVTGKSSTTIAAVPGMTISTSTATVGTGAIATITAMPAMTISTALADGVTITGHASIMVTGNEMIMTAGNPYISLPGAPGTSDARGEGQMLVIARWMGN